MIVFLFFRDAHDYHPVSKGSRNEPPGQLLVTASPCSNQDQLWRLFDLIPGTYINSIEKKIHYY